eukprot:TRINITY_DN46869_c0_g1_i1.p1 TRINITY_DN46869_c0_g1~~TRINITY_DN46869_c0_g1_i1.p1  ORF type:complete len:487 (+),score=113.54 TRINITY_DN46869_c0_g1_i1:86-1462(+)
MRSAQLGSVWLLRGRCKAAGAALVLAALFGARAQAQAAAATSLQQSTPESLLHSRRPPGRECRQLELEFSRLRRARQARCKRGNGSDPGPCSIGSNEHLPLLRALASKAFGVRRVLELGVHDVITTVAFLAAFPERLDSVDVAYPDKPRLRAIETLAAACGATQFQALERSSVGLRFGGSFAADGSDAAASAAPFDVSAAPDLVFVDTWHIGAQLARELEELAPVATRFLVLHDTTLFAYADEANWGGFPEVPASSTALAAASSRTQDGPPIGLWPAVETFLEEHPEWRLAKRCINNNGLTILARLRPGEETEENFLAPASILSKFRELPACDEGFMAAPYAFVNAEFQHSVDRIRSGRVDTTEVARLWAHVVDIFDAMETRGWRVPNLRQGLLQLHAELEAEATAVWEDSGQFVEIPTLETLLEDPVDRKRRAFGGPTPGLAAVREAALTRSSPEAL